jgi:RNA polymerase sigma factor (TIGR02999 family)
MAGGEPSTTPAAAFLPQVYDELCCLSRARLARFGGEPGLTPAELVHEAYLRVAQAPAGKGDEGFRSRHHFFFTVSRAMHDILVESARRKASLKRGGAYVVVSAAAVDDLATPGECSPEELLQLDLALDKFERRSPEGARVVRLSSFGGLTQPEIAAVLGLSLATVERRWRDSRAWLRRELSPPSAGRTARRGNHGA